MRPMEMFFHPPKIGTDTILSYVRYWPIAAVGIVEISATSY